MDNIKINGSVIAGGNVKNSNNGNITSVGECTEKDSPVISIERGVLAGKNVKKSNNDNIVSSGDNTVIIKRIRKETTIISILVSFFVGFAASILATYFYDSYFERKNSNTNSDGVYSDISHIEGTPDYPIAK